MRQLVSIAGVVPDRWARPGELADGATADHLILPLAEWLKAPAECSVRAGHLGVDVPPETAFATLQPYLDRLELIAVAFTNVSEGRGYSLARQLRERGQFRGELRATGEIFRDHVQFLARCGFDSFEVSAREDLQGALRALKSFSVAYQPMRTEPPSIAPRRRQI